ncbi:MAG: uracil phosphoribosyltransferase [Microthrixaceae bacterium]
MNPDPMVRVVDHPLVAHKLCALRHRDTPHGEFRRLAREITLLCAYEATSDLPTGESTVPTPLASAPCRRLRGPEPAVVGILRAGLVMVDAVLELLPDAAVGHLGMYRDPSSHEPVGYYDKLPDRLGERAVLVVDPMLATGGSAVRALDLLVEAGAQDVRLLCLVGCPEGVAAVRRAHPRVPIHLAALDSHLDENRYIVPGLGDAGDRIFGTQ